jgi:hypothetical protein
MNPLLRIQQAIVLAVLAALCGLAAGSVGGYRYAAALGGQDYADLSRQYAEQLAKAEAANRARLEQEVARGNRAEASLIDQQKRFAREADDLRRRIKHATTRYIPKGQTVPVAVPACVFTVDWLRQYNAAIGFPGIPPGTAPAGAEAASGTGGAADAGLRESGLNQGDILAHITHYGRRCRGLEGQLNELINVCDNPVD